MAKKPRGLRRSREQGTSAEMERYFFTGQEGFEVWGASKKRFQESLKYFEKVLLPAWIKKNPCSRPWAWWTYFAPRWQRKFDAYFDGKLPEPRQRLGGVGDPDFEFLGYVPHFEYGLPVGWITNFDVEYYNGVRKNIHGTIIPAKYKPGDFKGQAIDPENPPTYESEAAYLGRLGLLSKAEEKYLKQHPELLEPETVTFEEEDD